jgi:UDP-N-acetylglucosamine transferase subunit ALG13
MIFVTVGAQMPFERLVRTVDEWAARQGRNDVFAQIGPTEWRPRHIDWIAFLPPEEFRQRVAEATLLVAHAGMGSIITALELGKPILVMPRRGNLQETRNDHQVATAERFLAQGRIQVAFDEAELVTQLDRLEELIVRKRDPLSATASPELIQALRSFIGQAI